MTRHLRYFLITILFALLVFAFVQPVVAEENQVTVEFFFAEGCNHCEEKEPIIDDIEQIYENNITIIRLSVDFTENRQKFFDYGFTNSPGVVILNQTGVNHSIFRYETITLGNLRNAIDYHLAGNYTQPPPEPEEDICIETPFGTFCFNLSEISLPVITVIIGALDSINPCAFFVLLFLLSLLIYTKSRKRILLIGGIFIFFSGFIYFLLMLAILFFISAIEDQYIIALIAGSIAIVFGLLNIKDFFFFKKGPSASIPESQKPKLYKQMRKILKISSLPMLIIATIILAITANTVELACSFVLPVVYVGILKTYALSNIQNILYLIFYNLVYIIPLLILLIVIVITLGKWKLSEMQGRILKLFSGIMMFSLGLILLIGPNLIKNVFVAIVIVLISIISTILIFFIWKKFVKNHKSGN